MARKSMKKSKKKAVKKSESKLAKELLKWQESYEGKSTMAGLAPGELTPAGELRKALGKIPKLKNLSGYFSTNSSKIA